MSRGQAVIFRSMTLGLMLGLAACSGSSRPGGSPSQWGRGDYTPPGPASDPWGPYIREAANRFTVPEQWVRAVMHQESGGHEYQNGHLTRSGSGAMGLMQLMPTTWSELAAEFGLGNDPYEPHDNIMAGTGYIRQLYNKFGSPGFLAAYNAGPGRLEQYLETGGSLPDETVNYVASISPNLGDAVPAVTTTASPVMVASARTAPAYMVAQNTVTQNTVTQNTVAQNAVATGPVARTSDGCLRNVDAAYDPSNCLVDRDVPHADPAASVAPLAPPQPAVEVASAPPVAVRQQALPVELASYVEPASARAAPAYRLTPVAYTRPASGGGGWAVQVGAFSSGSDARVALAQAQAIIGRKGDASPVVTRVSPTAKSLYRARLVGFAAQDATTACRILHTHSVACFAVPQST